MRELENQSDQPMQAALVRGMVAAKRLRGRPRGRQSMHIAILLTCLGIGGAERQAIQLAEAMAADGNCVSLLVLRERLPQEWPTRLPVYSLAMRKTPWGLLAGFFRGLALMRTLRPQIVHSHTFPANLMARLWRILLPRTRVIATIHNVSEGARWRSVAYSATSSLCDQVTAVSQAVADAAIRAGAVSRDQVRVLPNGIDLDEWQPEQQLNPQPAFESHTQGRLAVRKRLLGRDASPETCFVWLTAGRIVPAKDYRNLLTAFALLLEELPEAELWIAGEAPDPAYLLELQSLRVPRHAAKVQWLGLRRDLWCLLDAADGFVLGSAWEGLPLVLGEAMAMGKPVVSTDAGGAREIVGALGQIVPVADSAALAAAMRRTMLCVLSSDAETLSARARERRRRISDEYGLGVQVARWRALYGEVCRANPDGDQ